MPEPSTEEAPVVPRPAGQSVQSTFQSYESLHFIVRGRNNLPLSKIANGCEEIYTKIMFDTNLLSFKPKENYLISIFRDKLEYQMETGYPSWSGGGAVTQLLGPSEKEIKSKTAIYTWETMAAPPLLAHEITHLVFNEFMDFSSVEDMDAVRWLNEGLATYEELGWYPEQERKEFLQVTKVLLRQNALPLNQAIQFKPFHEKVQWMGSYFFMGQTYLFSNIDLWYWEVRSVTEFLIEKEGQYPFFQFLDSLRRNKDLTLALSDAYPGKWKDLATLEDEWKRWL